MTDTIPTAEQAALRRRLARIARTMDSSIRIPLIGKRIGWDAVLGLIPGVGDLAGAAISAYIVVAAARLGVPRSGLARMLGNIGIETVIGAVPLLGDLFDMAFRANLRNVAVIEKHLGVQDGVQDGDGPGPDPRVAGLVVFVLGSGSVLALGAPASRLLASAL